MMCLAMLFRLGYLYPGLDDCLYPRLTFFFAFRVACMVEVVEVLVKVAQHNDLLRC
jgi:hypothetical protein